jgi:hypothetical protein
MGGVPPEIETMHITTQAKNILFICSLSVIIAVKKLCVKRSILDSIKT